MICTTNDDEITLNPYVALLWMGVYKWKQWSVIHIGSNTTFPPLHN